jgi:hypothetical protein
VVENGFREAAAVVVAGANEKDVAHWEGRLNR